MACYTAAEKINNLASKGEDYFVSPVVTLDKVKATRGPWLYSYFYDRIAESTAFIRIKDIYYKESHFFFLLLWTNLTIIFILFVALPENILLVISVLFRALAGMLVPATLCFGIYIWTGLILKHQTLDFSIRICLISCIILEVLIELFISIGIDFLLGKSLGITLLFTVVATGFYIEEKKHLTTSILVASSILLRFVIIDYDISISPLVSYMCSILGLTISALPTLRIPKCIDEPSKKNRFSAYEMSSISVIRQRRSSSVEIPTVDQNGVVPSQVNTRRKSLPVLGLPTRKVSMSSMDLTILGEAHGMITDLLADSSLPMNVTGTLRIVADMISPLLQHSFHCPSFSNTLLTVFEKNQVQEDVQQVMNQPDLKDDTPLSLKQRLQRNLGVTSSRRMSSSYTTTTSATGMPTIDMEYHAKNASPISIRSPSPKKSSGRSKSYAGLFGTVDRSKAFSKSHSFSQSPPTGSKTVNNKINSEDDIFKVEITHGKPIYFEGMENESDEDERSNESDKVDDTCNSQNDDNLTMNHVDKTKIIKETFRFSKRSIDQLAQVKEVLEKDDVADIISQTDNVNSPSVFIDSPDESITEISSSDEIIESDSDIKQRDILHPHVVPLAQHNVTFNIAEVAPVIRNSDNKLTPPNSLNLPANSNRRRSSRELHLEYEIAVSNEVNGLLSNLDHWDFPIFELSEKCNILTQLAFRIFQVCGFFTTFKIPEVTFLKYFRALESGYHNIPYHNRIHAADVLHGVYVLTQHKIPDFNTNLSRHSSINQDLDSQEEAVEEEEYTYGCISHVMPELELMALYTAASMHDFDHPGRTNAFLVATLNPKALLYNDRSVLENHHAAAAWSLLVTNPGLNFLSELDPVEFKRFRFIVIEQILSTDLKKHFDFLTEWNAKISEGLNFSNESDRLLVGQMAIKVADISGPSKEWNLHYRWTDRIIEEFYQQGEDEKTLGMPLSAYMDRNDPKVPQLQASFIKHLVSPLYLAYEKAGIMPGEWTDLDSDDEDNDDNFDGEGSDFVDPVKKKVISCVIVENIQRNHQKWLKIIEDGKEDNQLVSDEVEDIDEDKQNNQL